MGSDMSLSEKEKAALIEGVVQLARERVSKELLAPVEAFILQYYAGVAPEDLLERNVEDLTGAAMAYWQFLRQRPPGTSKIRVCNPNLQEHGWQSTHTIVEIITEDRPFLVDSVTMAINRRGFTIHLIIHPILRVRRDAEGRLSQIFEANERGEGQLESVIHAEMDQETDPEILQGLRAELEGVLEDVRIAVLDWPKMCEKLAEAALELEEYPPPLERKIIEEVKAFLRWIAVGNFTLLGCCDHEVVEEGGRRTFRTIPGASLGVLHEGHRGALSCHLTDLPFQEARLLEDPYPLVLAKSGARSTVHRPAYLDYIGIKRYGAKGEVTGERRLLGLYTSSAYFSNPKAIPLLRRKVEHIIGRSGFPPDSHSGKALLFILETYPRDELIQASEDELFETAIGILHLAERQRVRLFVRRDLNSRFLSCLVFVPRDRYNTELREQMQTIFRAAFNAEEVEFSISLSESLLARVHFVVHPKPGGLPDYDVREIEAQLIEAARTWEDRLQEALIEAHGEEVGNDLFRRYRDAFPAAYREDFTVRNAVYDIERIEAALKGQRLEMSLSWPIEVAENLLKFKLYHPGASIPLSTVLPMLENMGVSVIDDRPYAIGPSGASPVWLHDFGLRHSEKSDLNADAFRVVFFQDAFAQVWSRAVENDGFNRLVLRANLSARAIQVLRAYSKYLRQIGLAFSQSYMEEALANNPAVARLLIDLFQARFDPKREKRAAAAASILAARIEEALEGVQSLDEDRILRAFFTLLQATVRTNYFQRDGTGMLRPYLAMKLDPSLIPQLPKPRPMAEIFVYSARIEGVHLRGGKVARGGIRWSDRREDYRTEILGLMKAQMVKNAVIVPVGAKGGFIVKRPAADREGLRKEGIACYQTFIRGLLDLTDNRVGDSIVPPADVIRYDGDDPYLVVAADKGTAAFSDIANAITKDYGFWLKDAFASGGSTGYDHKKMGITARGAWECVKHHFSQLGFDSQTRDFSVVGIGDMAGDVFGNGMLLSRHIKLVGAFNHQHIFLDPNPDPEASFAERQRLFAQPASAWSDYNPSLISKGGGVYPRSAKSIPISPEVKEILDITANALTPADLIRALLKAPVDLLWNGGIGTFVKASHESHAEVGDRQNDGVRVNGNELRCRVVGEGGNLGFTQRGRVEYAFSGGRLNTDAIDNSGGVDCSDREVNLKIPLNAAVARGDLTEKHRNTLLEEMREEVAKLVLQDNYRQTRALTLAEAESEKHLEWFRRFMVSLEHQGLLHRQLEGLPDEETLAERKAARKRLTRPELAVLLAYAKISLYPAILASDMPDDPYLSTVLERYFPEPLRRRFPQEIQAHRLRREIIATVATNSLVNRAGIVFAWRLQELSGRDLPTVARAYMTARDVFNLREIWNAIDAIEGQVSQKVITGLVLETQGFVERTTRWFLKRTPRNKAIAATVDHFGPTVRDVVESLREWLAGHEKTEIEEGTRHYQEQGVPAGLAERIAGLGVQASALDLGELTGELNIDLATVAPLYYQLGERLGLDELRRQAARLPFDNAWQERARMEIVDELLELQRKIAAQALLGYVGDMALDAVLEPWLAYHREAIQRIHGLLADLQTSDPPDFAMMMVAVGEVRGLA